MYTTLTAAVKCYFQASFLANVSHTQDFPQCSDLNTPHLPPNGVISQAGYGAPCDRTPCQPGMSCCYNARNKAVCEGQLHFKCLAIKSPNSLTPCNNYHLPAVHERLVSGSHCQHILVFQFSKLLKSRFVI